MIQHVFFHHSKNGFTRSMADSSLFTKGSCLSLIILVVYVDDIISASPNQTVLHETLKVLAQHFKHKVIGDLNTF